jgi:hypothetical protein
MYTCVSSVDTYEHSTYRYVNANSDVLFLEHNTCPAIPCCNPTPHMKNRAGAAIVIAGETVEVTGAKPVSG